MKKLYRIFLDYDLGELWLDENKKPLSYVHSNDGDFSEYHNFIIKYLGGKLVEPKINTDIDGIEECDCKEAFYEILKPQIDKLK